MKDSQYNYKLAIKGDKLDLEQSGFEAQNSHCLYQLAV